MSVYVYESLRLKKTEQNDVARQFFTFVGGGFGISKKYKCKLCGKVGTAPSPRLIALSHRHVHPEIEEAFRKAGLFELWMEEKQC